MCCIRIVRLTRLGLEIWFVLLHRYGKGLGAFGMVMMYNANSCILVLFKLEPPASCLLRSAFHRQCSLIDGSHNQNEVVALFLSTIKAVTKKNMSTWHIQVQKNHLESA